MSKFVTKTDFEFFQHINREISSDVIDVSVILYQINLEYTNVNIYGEATEKVTYVGVELPASIKYGENRPLSDSGFGIDQTHDVQFNFVRRILQERKVYPEIGDIIYYNESFFEIDNITEAQLIANRPEYNNSIICFTHLTRRSDIQIEERQV